MQADEREINARPWLYRIARNRCLNHLRRNTAIAVDSMDVHYADAGQTTGEKVAKREEFRLLLSDIGRLPETQRTALLLREMEALSYQQIAHVMDTTVPSVKSLLVRARVSLAEAAESRRMTCDEVRMELGAVAEGLTDETAAIRRHLKDCDRCHTFRGQLRQTNRALAAVLPVAPLLLFKHLALKKLLLAKLGSGASAGAGGAAAGGATTAGAAGAAGVIGAGGGGGVVTAGAGALATKAVAGLAAAAIVTAGAVETRHASHPRARHRVTHLAVVAPTAVPDVATPEPHALTRSQIALTGGTAVGKHKAKKDKKAKLTPTTATPVATIPTTDKTLPTVAHEPLTKPTTQEVSSTTVLPPQPAPSNTPSQSYSGDGTGTTGASGPSGSPGSSSSGSAQPQSGSGEPVLAGTTPSA
jgi:Sigma-70, region 4/Sigma-70 region 2